MKHFHGTVVEVNYTQSFSDGYFLDEFRADIREYNGEHILIFILRYLQRSKHCSLTCHKKDLFDNAASNEFSFLLDVYKWDQVFNEKKIKSKDAPIKLITIW